MPKYSVYLAQHLLYPSNGLPHQWGVRGVPCIPKCRGWCFIFKIIFELWHEKFTGGSYTITQIFIYVLPNPPSSHLLVAKRVVFVYKYCIGAFNMNESKQLDCELKCTASSKCCESVQKDLDRPDKCLASLLEQEEDETKEYKKASDRASN